MLTGNIKDSVHASSTIQVEREWPEKPNDRKKTTKSNGITSDHRHHLLDNSDQESGLAYTKEVTSKVDKGGIMNEQNDDGNKSADSKPNLTQSLIKSFPVAKAEPETSRTAVVTAVETVTVSDRILTESRAPVENENKSRPALISVRIQKPSIDHRLGIAFQSVFGELLIGNINPNSLLANSPLRRGDRLVNMDQHRSISHWTALQAANYVREKQGPICFVVHTKNGNSNIAEAAVLKNSPDEKLGISFRNERGRLRINNISSGGLLGNVSILHPGDFVVSINGVDVSRLAPSSALESITISTGMITIRVTNTDANEVSVRDVLHRHMSSRRSNECEMATANEMIDWDVESGLMCHEYSEFGIRPGCISFKVYKPTVDTKVGITFSNTEDGQLQIGSIASQGMLGKSPLVPGFIILSIGRVPCRRWTKQQALDVVKASVGELLFIFYDSAGNTSYAMAVAYKSTPRSKIGLSFKSSGEHVAIGGVLSDGIFSDSILNAEDTVISINNIPCQYLTPSETVALTQRIPESVIVLVKLFRSNCVVVSNKSGAAEGGDYGNFTTRLQDDMNTERKQRQKAVCVGILSIVVVFITFFIFSIGADEGVGCHPSDYSC